MLRPLFTFILALFVAASGLYAQSGQGGLKGKVIDKETGEPLPFVNVVVLKDGIQAGGTASDFDGNYFIKPLEAGTYAVKASFTGYQPVQINGVKVGDGKIVFLNVEMSSSIEQLEEVLVVDYKVPLISKDNTTSGSTVTKEDLMRMPGRSAAAIATTVGGVYSKDDGSGDLNIRGSRSDANYYYIDGIKVRGSSNIPQSAIEEVSVMTGGLPAQYGDVTGGVISITTRGPSSQYFGSIEYVTSGFKAGDNMYGLDQYGYNLMEFSLAGPLAFKKDSAGNNIRPVVGFFISGNFQSIVDAAPTATGIYQINDAAYSDITTNPLRYADGATGTYQNAEYLRLNSFDLQRTRQNVGNRRANITGKLDFNTSSTTNLKIGGQFDTRESNEYLYSYSLYNAHHNPERKDELWRVYARFTQRFNQNADDEKSTVKNAYYTIQADYSQNTFRRWDENHRDNLFNYGYVGEFTRYQDRQYTAGIETREIYDGRSHGYSQDTVLVTGYFQETFRDTLIGFRPGELNPEATAYTSNYYNLYGWQGYDENGNPIYDETQASEDLDGDGVISDVERNFFLKRFDNIQSNGGMVNGDQPRNIYNLWDSPATVFNQYANTQQNQFRLTAMGSADIKNHAISVGFEYEQRVDRGYFSSPRGLWTIGNQLANNHLQNLDESVSYIDYSSTYPTISYERLNAAEGVYSGEINEDKQAFFDYNLRQQLGMDPDGTDFIDFHSLSPEQLSIDYFSPSELLNNGNELVNYYGYDPYGNRRTDAPSLSDFFNEVDDNGNYTRAIDAFRPVYVAGFVQDKFAFDDLIFNVGFRVDRYDANQSVLIDPYSLFPTIRAGEESVQDLVDQMGEYEMPGNIQDDYVVYVDKVNNPTQIVGYRDGNTWYNSEGSEIDDPAVLEGANGIAPLLQDPSVTTSTSIGTSSFKDYAPQTNFMPRISFSFPISDEALFFAHYDVLTKRPTTGERLSILDYYFLDSRSGAATINNPDLTSEKTIDYSLGFQQKVTNSSSVKMELFYREMRDMIQVIGLKGAYPKTYNSFGNIDFGTVTGTTITYDLRRTGNVWLKGSYTLQFAEGTGSSSTSALSLVRAGKQNLRTTTPLSYDQRHALVLTFDYRYGEGKKYNGPVVGGKQILKNTGANLQFYAGSGEPFSRQSNVTPTALINGGGAPLLSGSIHGARLPWQARLDMRIDKDFKLKSGSRPLMMNVYLQVLNALNALNVNRVYRATGRPDDDGYLTSPLFQNEIAAQVDEQAYREQYMMKVNDPRMYTLPRRLRLGVLLSF